MWYLTSDNDTRIIYIISSDEIIICRTLDAQEHSFAITDDPSISRNHASLMISDNNLVLKDLGSRYGTFINDSTEKAASNTSIILNNNDIVKFGKMNSIWKVHAASHITCTSTLKGENLQNLKLILSNIGGILKNDWDESCGYLTMPAITLTIKVVLALVQGSNIITPEFWVKCLEAVNNQTPLPEPSQFTPAVVESTLNKEVVSFLPDARRKVLFADKKFIFFSRRQFEMYKTVLTQSSAMPLLLSESRMSVSMLCEEGVIVIQYSQSTTSQETQAQRTQINNIITRLKAKGKRVVADAEIGLAILYCSTDKYCNPDFSFTSEVVKQNTENNKTLNVLAQESQEPASKPGEKTGNVVINESLVSEDNKQHILEDIERLSAKRKLGEFTNELTENPNKKPAILGHNTNASNETGKRKLPEEEHDISNPSKKLALNEKQDDDDLFNFKEANGNGNGNKAKKLNLMRPQKRKFDDDKDDGLFNFVQTDEEIESLAETKKSMFAINKTEEESKIITNIKVEDVSAVDIEAMRGVKLKELMESNIIYNDTSEVVKKERDSELEEKMSTLDLGCTIVITSNDLIVKKEPITVEEHNTSVKNFKKFKKVWPVKKQVTVMPASMSMMMAV